MPLSTLLRPISAGTEGAQDSVTPQRKFFSSSNRRLPFCFSPCRSLGGSAGGLSPSQEPRPSQLPRRILCAQRHLHRHLRHRIDNPLKVLPSYRRNFRIRRRIHEINRVRHAILHGKLHSIQVVPQSPAQSQRILLHAFLQRCRRGRRIPLHIPLMKRSPRIVLHDVYFLLPHYIATEIFIKLHPVLQSHAQIASLVVVMKELLRGVHLVYMLPPAARIRLEKSREADILKKFLPVQWKH